VGYLFGNVLESLLEDLKNVELLAFAAIVLIGLTSVLVHKWTAKSYARKKPEHG
jgi:hypothetical protein